MPIAAYTAALDGTIRQATGPLIALLGARSEDSVLGTCISDYCVHLGDKAQILGDLRAGPGLQDYLVELRRLDQRTCWIRLSIVPVFDSLGQLSSRHGYLQDVTDWKTSREQAKESRTRLSLLRNLLRALSRCKDEGAEAIDQARNILREATGLPCAILMHRPRHGTLSGDQREEFTGWQQLPASVRHSLHPWVQYSLTSGRTLVLPESAEEPNSNRLPSALADLPPSLRGPTRFVAVPMQGNSAAVGAIVYQVPRSIGPVTSEQLSFFESTASCLGLAIECARLRRDRSIEETRIKHLSQARLDIQENERARIARELHDEIGQALTALEFSVEDVRRSVSTDGSPRLRAGLQDIAALTSGLHESIRELSHGLRPSMLDDIGLEAALEWYVHAFSKRSGIRSELELVGIKHHRLPANLETMLYRITQEALTNAARHAHPTRISVRVVQTAFRIIWSFRDDGRGFDVEKTTKKASPATGIGLLDMKERVEILGGRFRIRSAPGEGTALHAEVPHIPPGEDTLDNKQIRECDRP